MTSGKDGFDKKQAAEITAKTFLEIGAVHFYGERPFTFTSGWASPVYIDCRRLISFPDERRKIMDLSESYIRSEIGTDTFDAVAGFETAGIPYAAWLSDKLDMPMQYVRKEPKGFARNALIEGKLGKNQRTLLVDDLATDGRSKIRCCKALRDAGASVENAFTLFFYDIFPEGPDKLTEQGVTLHSLATWVDVLAAAKESASIQKDILDEVQRFVDDPVTWSKRHGGVGEEQKIGQPYTSRPVKY